MFIFFIIAMLLSISGLDFLTAISGAASALSNVGPGLGEMIGPNGNYKAIPDLSRDIIYRNAIGKVRAICSFSIIFSIFLEKLKK